MGNRDRMVNGRSSFGSSHAAGSTALLSLCLVVVGGMCSESLAGAEAEYVPALGKRLSISTRVDTRALEEDSYTTKVKLKGTADTLDWGKGSNPEKISARIELLSGDGQVKKVLYVPAGRAKKKPTATSVERATEQTPTGAGTPDGWSVKEGKLSYENKMAPLGPTGVARIALRQDKGFKISTAGVSDEPETHICEGTNAYRKSKGISPAELPELINENLNVRVIIINDTERTQIETTFETADCRVSSGSLKCGNGEGAPTAPLAPACSFASVTSSFTSDLEDWEVSDTVGNGSSDPAEHVSTGGIPDGYVRVQATGANATFLKAPAKFLGSWAGLDGVGELSFRHRVEDPGSSTRGYVDFVVVAYSSTGGASARWTGAHPNTGGAATATDWVQVHVPIEESEWRMEQGTWSDLLDDVTKLDVQIEVVNNGGLPDDLDAIDSVVLGCAGAVTADTCGFTSQESTFDTDEEGWIAGGPSPGTLSHAASGGNPGGFLQWVDTGSYRKWVGAPARFLGSWSALDGVGTLSFDHKIIVNAGTVLPLIVAIRGSNGASAEWKGSYPPLSSPLEWITVEVPIRESEWTVTGDWAGLLADVSQLDIDIELTAGLDTDGLDNVRLEANGCAALRDACGDADQDINEQCDDGNASDGDGCSSTCEIEAGYSCTEGFAQEVTVSSIADCVGGPSPSDPSGVLAPVALPEGDYEAAWVSGCIDHNATDWRAEITIWTNGAGTETGIFAGDTTATEAECLALPNTAVTPFTVPNGAATYVGLLDNAGGPFCGDNVEGIATFRLSRASVCSVIPVCGNGSIEAGEDCDDGGTTPGDGCGAACLNEYYVFQTSGVYTPGIDFVGLAGADSLCQSLAESAGLASAGFPVFQAWMSDSTQTPPTRFAPETVGTSGAFILVDGTQIADNWADLLDSTIDNAVDVDQDGNFVPLGTGTGACNSANDIESVWTGTFGGGTATGVHCNDWTSSGPGVYGSVGDSRGVDFRWTHSTCIDECDVAENLYCVQQASPAPVPTTTTTTTSTTTTLPIVHTFYYAFVSNALYSGAFGGLAGADQLCHDIAETGIPALAGRNWMAWLSDTTNGPATRFTTQAAVPYKLPNNSTIAPNWAGLTDGGLNSQLRINHLAQDVGTGKPVYTNTKIDGQPRNTAGDPALDNCSDWTATSGSALMGGTEQNATWTERNVKGCAGPYRIFCFEVD